MELSTERINAVKQLTEHGFRIQFSNEEFTLLAKPKHYSTFHVARVDNDGRINQQTLSDFLCNLLNYPTSELAHD